MNRSISTKVTMVPPPGLFAAILCFLFLASPTNGQSCIDDFHDIYKKEDMIADTSIPRVYIVCPRHIFDVGNLDFNGNVIQPITGPVNPPLPLRPNMTLKCGDQGLRDNRCWIRGGDLHVDGTKVLGISDDTVENVVLEGFTFIGARDHALLVNKRGSITFRDCEFRDFVQSSVPIMLDYYDASNPSTELVATFVDCDFRDNRFFGMTSQTALIYGNSNQNRIEIENVIFEKNDMVWNNTRPDTHSYIVESLGPVNVRRSCFMDNLVGASDVVVFGSTFNNELNFAKNSSGSLCPFISVFETMAQFQSFTPTCVDTTSSDCDRFATPSPTGSPSANPTASPAPSVAPSASPTISPQPTNSPMPTTSPTTPTSAPTDVTTASPTILELDFFWPTIMTEAPISAAPISAQANTVLLLLGSAGFVGFLL